MVVYPALFKHNLNKGCVYKKSECNLQSNLWQIPFCNSIFAPSFGRIFVYATLSDTLFPTRVDGYHQFEVKDGYESPLHPLYVRSLRPAHFWRFGQTFGEADREWNDTRCQRYDTDQRARKLHRRDRRTLLQR